MVRRSTHISNRGKFSGFTVVVFRIVIVSDGPIGPVGPVVPVAPDTPVAPVTPRGPVAPVEPVGPVTGQGTGQDAGHGQTHPRSFGGVHPGGVKL